MNEILIEIGIAVLIVIAAWIISWVARYILTGIVKRLIIRTSTQLDNVIVNALDFPFRAAILVGGFEYALFRLSFLPPSWSEANRQIIFVLYSLLIFIFLYRLITGLVVWYGDEIAHKTETKLDDKFLELFRRIAYIILILVFTVIVLGQFGIEVSALVTTLGIGSLAIALAAQETLSDMFSGFTIMVDRPFTVGDRVELLDINTWGDVVDIGLRSTRILTRDNRTVTVPNSVIGKGLIVNYSAPNTKYRVQTHVGVAYGTDIEHAREIMIEAIQKQDWVMQNERIEALFLEFGDSSLNFRVRCWIEHYVETRRIIDKMNSALYKALNENHIEIPFPQRDVHIIPPTSEQ